MKNTVQENIKKMVELESIVKGHLVGGKMEYTGTHVRVIFVDIWSGLNGVQVSLDGGKINALEILLCKLDSLYNVENHWSNHFKPIKSL